MCADLGRLRRGQKTRTGMTEAQLKDFCKMASKSTRKKKR